ncbi:MAG: TolC family protein [Ferruginibacter sp.]|nr:TolC family protein [Cytophagales bacterium]
MVLRLLLPVLVVLLFGGALTAQELDSLQPANVLALEEVIDLAKQQSPAYYQITNFRESRYWAWRAYQANYRPQLVLSGNLPDYRRAFSQVEQNDGSILPQFVNLSNSSLRLSLNQNIGLTGGQIFASTELQRVDNFVRDTRFYNSSPAVIGFNQPLFNYNELYWDKRIEPLRYEESKKQYAEELENIAVVTTGLFFDLLLAQISLEIALKNQANNDTIYKIGQGRYNLGRIAENELLQLELALMKSNQDASQARLDLETSTLRLKTNVGLVDRQRVQLVPPVSIPTFLMDETLALSEARKNRRDVIAYQRQVLEGERDVAQARGQSSLNANLFAQYGLSSQATTIPDVYARPDNQQIIQLGFTIPIVDWGRAKSLRKTAQSSYERTKNVVAQLEVNFEQEIYTQVKQFDMLREQLKITAKSDEIAQKRYDISKNRYLIGKIGITDLNIALTDKDQAKRSYVQSLRQFWTSYYTLRRLTLYDFAANTPLLVPNER